MKEKVLLWKTVSSEKGNFHKLLGQKYLYWSKDPKFNSLELGDYIFILNIETSTVLFAKFAGDEDLKVTEKSDTTEVYDSKIQKTFVAEGTGWPVFLRFEILSKGVIPESLSNNFKFFSQNGTVYFYKQKTNKKGQNSFVPSKTALKNGLQESLLKINLSPLANEVLSSCIDFVEKLDVVDKQKKNKVNESKLTEFQILKQSHLYITSKGFKYSIEEIYNFYLCLKTKPFIILAGISGTGKTQLPRKFAEAVGMKKEQVIQVPVRPDWTDSSDLLGYTSLEGNFIPKDLTLAIQKAESNPNLAFFFILDEMNLARVEHYFSDFLSVIETRERINDKIKTDPILREEATLSAKNKEDFSELGWPQNLYLIGTVNMDETTNAFSRKVLDRANSIEMNEVDLSWLEIGNEQSPITGVYNDFFLTLYLSSSELSKKEKQSIDDEFNLLIKINDILKTADLHFAYRVRDEIAFYLVLNKQYELMEPKIAFDFQIVQKILPRIHGSSERIQKVLVELLNLLEGTDFRSSNFEYSVLDGKIDKLTYRRTSNKIIFMLKRFDDDRFTSFWL